MLRYNQNIISCTQGREALLWSMSILFAGQKVGVIPPPYAPNNQIDRLLRLTI